MLGPKLSPMLKQIGYGRADDEARRCYLQAHKVTGGRAERPLLRTGFGTSVAQLSGRRSIQGGLRTTSLRQLISSRHRLTRTVRAGLADDE